MCAESQHGVQRKQEMFWQFSQAVLTSQLSVHYDWISAVEVPDSDGIAVLH